MWPNPRVPYELASSRKKLSPPNNKPLIVHVVMNIEYWPFDKNMPRGILPPPHGKVSDPPDLPNYSWVEYGMRVGLPRLIKLLRENDIPVSAFINAQVAEIYPSAFREVCDLNWELVGHGWFQESLRVADNEEQVIKKSLKLLRELSGQPVRSWFGPGGGETENTPELLKDNGIEFLHDWLIDELPCWMRTKSGPILAMPYTFELNDVPIWTVQNNSCDEMYKRVNATLEVFDEEKLSNTKIITLALHPHIVGVPQNFNYFKKTIQELKKRDDVTFMTSSQIGDWFIKEEGTNGEALIPYLTSPPN
ncbi:polysaccharide deacetylase family protein [bacterium]|nr:polysaccharide deacetylase family protein [Alphaproteobacteria bacterium]MDC1055766.1 polysaccharide deacetylase family protein [bacterium]